ncbi:hypothetical protein FZEAL_530 [Fusarium zealandicum]|uniref:aminodeoxychorismate synthase n=1 Tax=Fusarium zealandicum TaxID=1053134 RepID=A0A8H4UV89_9HYPO|nr:hypothetical protein FZEAL_530 [Fusarium zealandicum]
MATGPNTDSEASAKTPKRILFIDAYDSFTNNIVSLLRTILGAEVFVVRIDLSVVEKPGDDTETALKRWTEAEFIQNLPQFDAVVCGPGPGSPLNPEDVGAFRLLWDLPEQLQLPVLGICLGFQSLVAAHGGAIRRLQRGLHGMVREIEHRHDASGDIFQGVPSFKATLYHSLCADIGQDDDDEWQHDKRWMSTARVPQIMPLAWTTEDREDGRRERILMGAKHVTKPFWGLQYHPESVCTEMAAQGVLVNWFRAALQWNKTHGRRTQTPLLQIETLSPPNHLESVVTHKARAWRTSEDQGLEWWLGLREDEHLEVTPLKHFARGNEYTHRTIPLPQGVGVPEIVETLGLATGESVILDSSSTKNGDPLAVSSIVALEVETALRFEHNVSDDHVTVRLPGKAGDDRIETISLEDGTVNVWEIISDFWEARSNPLNSGQTSSAFKGGFMGFITYEMGLHGLEKKLVSGERGHERPDICLAWVTKSIVLDHRAGVAHVQNLKQRGSDDTWLEATTQRLQTSENWNKSVLKNGINGKQTLVSKHNDRVKITTPEPNRYEEQVRVCQDFIAAGNSYELCLTSQTTMARPRRRDTRNGMPRKRCDDGSPWAIYQTLRQRQPAPFGSFIRLGGATLLSSSPERFLRHDSNGLCSMRPMKGTVRKSEAVSTLAQAEEILHVPKEIAENLMIVDLVRHDLHGVCGVGNVTVPDLMKVEEYATVFQMITVVNGQLPGRGTDRARWSSSHPRCPYTGLDALAAALPPGSMTGAPKKRSCEILQVIEGHQERSLYSGVVGYMDVTGAGDWSVTIRTMFRWDDEQAPAEKGETEPREVWRIGAGGAVTILSTPDGERDEMFTKLAGPLGVFRDAA